MDEITFADILTHYEGRLRETSEEIEHVKRILKSCVATAEGSWSGNAADAFSIKIEEINAELAKSHNELSEALNKLNVVGALFAEGEI